MWFGLEIQELPWKERINKGKTNFQKITNLFFVNKLNKMWTKSTENKGM